MDTAFVMLSTSAYTWRRHGEVSRHKLLKARDYFMFWWSKQSNKQALSKKCDLPVPVSFEYIRSNGFHDPFQGIEPSGPQVGDHVIISCDL